MIEKRLVGLGIGLSVALGVLNQAALAEGGFFSKDGSVVTMALQSEGGGIASVNVASGKITRAPLPAELAAEAYVNSVARGSDGEALFLVNDSVWVWAPGDPNPVRRVCSTSPVRNPDSIFVATKPGTPFTDCIFVSGNTEDEMGGGGTLFARKPGGSKDGFVPIFCRRVREATGGAYSDDGRLFFVSDGDLWEGGIEPEEDAGMERMGTLVGARIAPLAILNTDEGNSGGEYIFQVAPAGNWIYLLLHGRHTSTIVRVPISAKPLYAPGQLEFPTVKEQIDAMTRSLTRTEIIADELSEVYGFCATEAGGKPRVFYATRTGAEGKGLAMMLWEGESRARIIGYMPVD